MSTAALVAGAPGLWLYLLVTASAAVPLAPSEVAVAGAAAHAARSDLTLPAVAVAAATGALSGDVLTYHAGRRAAAQVRQMRAGSARNASLRWVTEQLARHGLPVLVFARFVPGGRTAAALIAGTVRYPRRHFAVASILGATLWAGTYTTVGYLGGQAHRSPVLGALLAAGVLVTTGTVVTVVRRARSRARRPIQPVRLADGPPSSPAPGSP